MGYYRGGDFYRGGGYYRAGGLIGNILGGIGRVVGGMGIPVVSGIASTAAGLIGGGRSSSSSSATLPATASVGPKPKPGIVGAMQRAIPGGASGMLGGRRHMNVGNAKAARRAIRRITGVRRMLMSIERSMPHRKCTRPHAKRR